MMYCSKSKKMDRDLRELIDVKAKLAKLSGETTCKR